jgi:hypothetical protein
MNRKTQCGVLSAARRSDRTKQANACERSSRARLNGCCTPLAGRSWLCSILQLKKRKQGTQSREKK